MTAPQPTLRWYRPTPDRLILALLAVQCLLWLSEQFQWFPFNQHQGWAVLIAVAVVGTTLLVMLLWFIIALLFRLHFQFSIRSLLILTVVVAIPCSWLAVKMQQVRRERDAAAAIEKLGGSVEWSEPSRPMWLRRLLGDDFFRSVAHVKLDGTEVTDAGLENLKGLHQLQYLTLEITKVTDAGLENLKGLHQLINVNLDNTKITDAGLENLKGLHQLQWLYLGRTKVTDAGLEKLTRLNQLRVLDVGDTKVTDEGVKKLTRLNQLQVLELRDTKVTDEGVKKLTRLNQLQVLDLGYTKVTDEGVKKLRKALPNCQIGF